MSTEYENNEEVQDDKAHFIELIAATSLFDFLTRPDKERPSKPTYLARAIASDAQVLELSTMGSGYSVLTKHIADFTLLNMLVKVLKSEKSFPLSITRHLNTNFYNDASFLRLEEFMQRFMNWYDELSNNNRSFSPLNILSSNQPLSAWIKGNTLNAKDDSFYLLQMIKSSNVATKDESHDNRLRHLLNFAYQAIDHYTHNIVKQ
jgi:hypothetical protein